MSRGRTSPVDDVSVNKAMDELRIKSDNYIKSLEQGVNDEKLRKEWAEAKRHILFLLPKIEEPTLLKQVQQAYYKSEDQVDDAIEQWKKPLIERININFAKLHNNYIQSIELLRREDFSRVEGEILEEKVAFLALEKETAKIAVLEILENISETMKTFEQDYRDNLTDRNARISLGQELINFKNYIRDLKKNIELLGSATPSKQIVDQILQEAEKLHADYSVRLGEAKQQAKKKIEEERAMSAERGSNAEMMVDQATKNQLAQILRERISNVAKAHEAIKPAVAVLEDFVQKNLNDTHLSIEALKTNLEKLQEQMQEKIAEQHLSRDYEDHLKHRVASVIDDARRYISQNQVQAKNAEVTKEQKSSAADNMDAAAKNQLAQILREKFSNAAQSHEAIKPAIAVLEEYLDNINIKNLKVELEKLQENMQSKILGKGDYPEFVRNKIKEIIDYALAMMVPKQENVKQVHVEEKIQPEVKVTKVVSQEAPRVKPKELTHLDQLKAKVNDILANEVIRLIDKYNIKNSDAKINDNPKAEAARLQINKIMHFQDANLMGDNIKSPAELEKALLGLRKELRASEPKKMSMFSLFEQNKSGIDQAISVLREPSKTMSKVMETMMKLGK